LILSIIIPVYNEAPRLEQFIRRFFAVKLPVEREVIFVDDGSRDESRRILSELAPRYGFRLVSQERNQGKGAAVKAGIQAATGDYILIQDADFEYDPAEIPRLLRPISQGRADVVYGSRFKRSGTQVHQTFHYTVNRLLTFLSNLLSGIYLTDMETCYKVFPRDLLQAMRLTSKRFGVEVEMTAYLARTSARIVELPISYRPRSRMQGKKIRWTDGLAALFHLVRYNSRSSARCFQALPERYRS
jgi:glycosyltransferase involved in cell wall biosynthesis